MMATVRFPWFVMFLGLLALAGCGGSEDRFVKARYGPQDGVASLDTEQILVVFESVPLRVGNDLGHEWQMKVSGRMRTSQGSGISGTKLMSEYDDGVNTITLDRIPRFVMRISDEGRKAEVGGITIPLTGQKRKVVVHADGTATVS